MSELPELLVPYGSPQVGPLVRAEDALPGERYTCPDCWRPLQLRAVESEHMRQHFFHPAPMVCTQESVIHATAKRLIRDLIRDNAAGECDRIRIHLSCECCARAFALTPQGGYYSSAEEEQYVGAYRCDVVGLKGDEVRLAVEVVHTHKMHATKVDELSCRWLEVVAGDILSEPAEWRPRRAGMGDGRSFRCDDCKRAGREPLVRFEKIPPGTNILKYLSSRVSIFAEAEEAMKAWDKEQKRRESVSRWLREKPKK